MSDQSKRRTVLVGLLVSGAMAILAGGILLIGRINDSFSRKITATALFDEVGGLQKGDNIWFAGLKVGTVRRLGFVGSSQVEVELDIDETAAPFIPEDAEAKVGSDGLIGNRIVVIYGGSQGVPSLQDGDILPTSPEVSTSDVLAMLQKNNTNLLAITTDLKQISAGLVSGEGSLGQLLKDKALYESLAASAERLNQASASARSLTASLAAFSADLNRPGNLPHQLVSDRTSHAALTATLAQLDNASTQASALATGLVQQAQNPATPVGTLLNDVDAGKDLKQTLDRLNQSSALLTEDLEALQHSWPLRRTFRKRARQEEKAADKAAEAAARP